MNSISFLLEKGKTDCLCFQTAQNQMESVYEQPESIFEIKNNQYPDLLMVKRNIPKQKNKKKSLRNLKHPTLQHSVQNPHSQMFTKKQFNLNPECRQIQKQQGTKINMDFSTIMKSNIHPYLLIKQINAVYKSQSESQNFKNQNSKTFAKNQYEELVDKEFRKDFHLFCLSIEQNSQNSKYNKNYHQARKINQNDGIQAKQLKETLFLYAKQIESEKEGTNTESASSEIIGRGLEGFTEQRISIQDIQQIIFDERKTDREKTLITRESQIEISQIKSFTERASSFTMLRTTNRTSMLFGSSFQRQGSIGLSKHLQKFKDQTKPCPE